MGLCVGTGATRPIFEDEKPHECPSRFLILGTGGSGKTTIFKQLITRYGDGYTEAKMKRQSTYIHQNVISGLDILIEWAEESGHVPGVRRFSETLNEALECLNWPDELNYLILEYIGESPSVAYIKECTADQLVTPQIADIAADLWKDTIIQRTFLERANDFPYDFNYLISRLDSIKEPNYLPTLEDTLHCCKETRGIYDSELHVNGKRVALMDVGGYYSERKKWYRCYEGVSCLLYVASLADYDGMLYEGGITRMCDSLDVFDSVCYTRYFLTTPVVVFLNKSDIFRQKIKHSLFSSCPSFATYRGPDPPVDFDAALDYVISLFRDIHDRNVHSKPEIYFHIICAVDTTETILSHAFENIRDQYEVAPAVI